MRPRRFLLAVIILLGSAPIDAQAVGGALAPLRGRISPNLFAVRVTRNADTTNDAMATKWREWLGFAQPGLGPVGSYEGGFVRYDQGVWRPSPQSRMNGFANRLDAIGKERAIHSIHEIVDPLDDHGPRAADVAPTARLWVRVVDPAVISVEWFVDGLPAGSGEYLDLASLPLPHQIEARARDAVLDHAFSDNLAPHPLDLVRPNLGLLTQTVGWRTVVP